MQNDDFMARFIPKQVQSVFEFPTSGKGTDVRCHANEAGNPAYWP